MRVSSGSEADRESRPQDGFQAREVGSEKGLHPCRVTAMGWLSGEKLLLPSYKTDGVSTLLHSTKFRIHLFSCEHGVEVY